MKKLVKSLIGTILLATMLFLSPSSISAHHGGSNWVTDHTYFECIGGNQHTIEAQHRHLNGKTEYRIFRDPKKVLIGVCILNTPEEDN